MFKQVVLIGTTSPTMSALSLSLAPGLMETWGRPDSAKV